MGLSPEITDKPPFNIGAFMESKASAEYFAASFTAARALALADVTAQAYGAEGGLAVSDPLSYTKETFSVVAGRSAQIQLARYRFKSYSATCYLKVYWDEVVYDGNLIAGTSVEVSRTAKDWTQDAVDTGGVCLPAGFDNADPTTWIISGWNDAGLQVLPGDPASGGSIWRVAVIENLRWSCLSSYVPAVGDNNAFPA